MTKPVFKCKQADSAVYIFPFWGQLFRQPASSTLSIKITLLIAVFKSLSDTLALDEPKLSELELCLCSDITQNEHCSKIVGSVKLQCASYCYVLLLALAARHSLSLSLSLSLPRPPPILHMVLLSLIYDANTNFRQRKSFLSICLCALEPMPTEACSRFLRRFRVAPNSFFKISKERVRSDLKRLKNQLLVLRIFTHRS